MATEERHEPEAGPPAYPRRLVLGAAGLAIGALAACSDEPGTASARQSPSGPGPTASPPAGVAGASAGHDATPSGGARGTATGPPARPRIATTDGPDIVHGPRTRGEVALTFHGQGPAELTRQVLEECRAADARVTVFAVGIWLADDPALGRAILEGGHELGNHTWSHQQMKQLGAAEADREVARGAEALRAAVGSAGWWFRPSGTQHSTATIRSAARRAGYHRCVSYDVDPEDYLDPGAALVRSRTRRAVRAGSVVSLHLGHAGTVEALPLVLADLSSMGLRAVSLSTMLRD